MYELATAVQVCEINPNEYSVQKIGHRNNVELYCLVSYDQFIIQVELKPSQLLKSY